MPGELGPVPVSVPSNSEIQRLSIHPLHFIDSSRWSSTATCWQCMDLQV